ncbi:MAG: phosphoglycerate dehydrogenase, partial [Candidatus Brocadiae bacterium]|nr:phosphoglycerate dehydrogenase [Candidatus Brocadiia bacterium]
LAAQLGKLVAQLSSGQPEAIEVACKGALAQENTEPVVQHGVTGVMQGNLGDQVNIISAPYLAQERGIRITSSRTSGPEGGFTDLIEVRLTADTGTAAAAGTLLGREQPRIVRIGEFDVELVPEGHLLIVFNNDMPGCVGWVGATLGEAGINIARMGVSRQQAGGNALLTFNLDSPCQQAVLAKVQAFELVQRVIPVVL